MSIQNKKTSVRIPKKSHFLLALASRITGEASTALLTECAKTAILRCVPPEVETLCNAAARFMVRELIEQANAINEHSKTDRPIGMRISPDIVFAIEEASVDSERDGLGEIYTQKFWDYAAQSMLVDVACRVLSQRLQMGDPSTIRNFRVLVAQVKVKSSWKAATPPTAVDLMRWGKLLKYCNQSPQRKLSLAANGKVDFGSLGRITKKATPSDAKVLRKR